MSRRAGIVSVSLGLLGEILHLPEGHRVIAVRPCADAFGDTTEIAVEGPSLPEVPEGAVIPRVQYVVSVTEEPELVRSRTFSGKFI
jgi:hypothetical protein